MSGHRIALGTAAVTSAVVALALHGLILRPRMLTWGATPDEVARGYPGDDLVPDAESSSTMATTLPAPPEQVWPWLVQMGGDRAGWYSWDRLDRMGEPSATAIVPEWQSLEEGQRLIASPDGRSWFTVALVEPERTLVLRSSLELPSGHSFDVGSAQPPRAYLDGVWGFHLRPAPGDRTRLVVRTRGSSRPRRLTWLLSLLFGEPAHLIMQVRQFHNLRTRLDPARDRTPA
ncbi:hypothetical protein [Kitasatospora sp. A2-31]|uniref:hypothetical protein n=1 Tax=Kitasatospora sp. A2-31 TaxID=2916414 RepID=UPI001EEBD129|nr:hypothetical protein [Kitasatospora sp. A2-31]MCG6494335.1 hypothetical protein [Kitasatospora sp. A2-31]